MTFTDPKTSFLHCLKACGILLLTLVLTNDSKGQSTATRSVQPSTEREYRLRYPPFQKWQAFHAPTYHLYYPQGYDSVAAFISRELPPAIELIRRRSGLAAPKNPQLILYPSTTALYRSNIGTAGPGTFSLPTFVTKGTRLLIPFDGDYKDLGNQLKRALMQGAWEARFPQGLETQAKGGDDIPNWYKEGTIAFMAEGWQPGHEDALKTLYKSQQPQSWYAIIGRDGELAGRALNYYLTRALFPQAAQGTLFRVAEKKSLPRGIRLVAKAPYDTVLSRCYRFYQTRFGIQSTDSNTVASIHPDKNKGNKTGKAPSLLPIAIRKPKGRLLNWTLSPDGTTIAITTSERRDEQRTLWLYQTGTKRLKKAQTCQLPPWYGTHPTDPYPLLGWEGNTLWTLQPERGQLLLRRATASNSDKGYRLKALDGIGAFTPMGGDRFLLAAHRYGQSDLVVYDGRRDRYTPLTNDPYDDTRPLALPDATTTSLIWNSDRPDKKAKDTTQHWHGLYQLKGDQPRPLATDTLDRVQWDGTQAIDHTRLLVRTTQTGTTRWQELHLPSNGAITHQDKGQGRRLTTGEPLQYLKTTDKIVTLQTTLDSLFFQTEPMNDWLEKNKATDKDTTSPWLTDYRNDEQRRKSEDSLLSAARDTTPSFLGGVLDRMGSDPKSRKTADSLKEAGLFRPSKAKPYVLQLYSAYFTARVNNDYYINRLQPYRTYQGTFQYPKTGALAQGGYSDLFENHHFTVAYRLPSGTDGSDFFVKYENKRDRTGWGATYFRKVERLQPDPQRDWRDAQGRRYPNLANVKTHYYEVFASRPIAYDASGTITVAFRKDRTVFLATDQYSLGFEALRSQWLMGSVNGILDKRLKTLPQLYRGYRLQGTLDAFNGFGLDKAAVFAAEFRAEEHLPLYRGITLQIKGRAGISGGDARLLYNLGGVDGAVNPKADSSVLFSQSSPYAFQTLATALRGYPQNSLFGDRYALGNIDLVVPIMTVLKLKTPLPSLNELQLGLFADGAAAQESWQRNNNNNKPKGLWSYGLTGRTLLAGYPISASMGWPGALNRQPLWYLSLTVQ